MKLQPALIFGENMVLQRGEPLPVWGRSVRGDKVTVTLGGNTAVSDAPQGEWKVTLPAMEASRRAVPLPHASGPPSRHGTARFFMAL